MLKRAGARGQRAALGQLDFETGPCVIWPGGARAPTQVLMNFIDAHCGAHGFEPICNALQVARPDIDGMPPLGATRTSGARVLNVMMR